MNTFFLIQSCNYSFKVQKLRMEQKVITSKDPNILYIHVDLGKMGCEMGREKKNFQAVPCLINYKHRNRFLLFFGV